MKIRGVLWVAVLCAFSGFSMIGCQYFPESTFELASESRLPKWFSPPPGLRRADVSITMNYYVKPWGRSATFVLHNGKTRAKADGKLKGNEPLQLKNPPQGFPSGYPSYEVITVNGITDINAYKKLEPYIYLNDDPENRDELIVERYIQHR